MSQDGGCCKQRKPYSITYKTFLKLPNICYLLKSLHLPYTLCKYLLPYQETFVMVNNSHQYVACQRCLGLSIYQQHYH